MRIMRTFAVGLTLVIVAAACGGAAGPSGQSPAPAATAAAKPRFELATYMYKLQTQGKFKLCTRENNIPFGSKNPTNNKFEGFDVDISREIVKAIFGSEGDVDQFIEFVPVVSATRIPTLTEGKCDMVASTMTITEDRKKQIDFSDVYFRTGQRLLVKSNSTITGLKDLAGKTVCTAKGSTSERNLTTAAPQARPLLLDDYPPCLLAMQQNQAEAVTTDETILFGLKRQDPNTKLVGEYFSDEPYGLGIKKDNHDRVGFADFVNRELVKIIQDGRWAKIYEKHITPVSGDKKQTPDQR